MPENVIFNLSGGPDEKEAISIRSLELLTARAIKDKGKGY